MSRVWLDYTKTRDDVTIVGLVDISEEQARKLASQYNLDVPIFQHLNEALEQVNANLVFDITPPNHHKEIVTTALKAGVHVFGEKPMAESLKDAKEILSVVEKTNKTYSVMQNYRFNPHLRSIQKVLQDGMIGKISSIHADFFIGAHFGGFRELMEDPLLVDMAIHTFDQARLITDANPVSVYSHAYNPDYSWYQGNASASCIFEMDRQIVFTYNGSWCASGKPSAWNSEWRIIGSKGMIRWNGLNDPLLTITEYEKETQFIYPYREKKVPKLWEGNEGHFGCLDEMFAALRENRPAETDCYNHFQSLSMVFGALESAQAGKKIYLR